MIDQDVKNNPVKSLCMFNDIYHVWLSVGSQNSLDINVSDSVTNTSYIAGEFNGFRYQIKNARIFNDVFLKAAKEKPTIIKKMLSFYHEQHDAPDTMRDIKIKFTCFRRRINIYIHRQIRGTKQLLWD